MTFVHFQCQENDLSTRVEWRIKCKVKPKTNRVIMHLLCYLKYLHPNRISNWSIAGGHNSCRRNWFSRTEAQEIHSEISFVHSTTSRCMTMYNRRDRDCYTPFFLHIALRWPTNVSILLNYHVIGVT